MVRHLMRALPLLVVWLGGCDAGSYEVAVTFDPGALADEARAIELALVPDCGAQALGAAPLDAVQSQTLTRAGAAMTLEPVPPGSYGLYGRARSADCAVVAAGCVAVDLAAGGSGVLRLTLRPSTGSGCSEIELCDDGVCGEGGEDGGPRDAGPSDGGRPDAGPECSVDGECDDGIACTADTCESGICVFAPDDASCGEGEVCQLATGCGVPCTGPEMCDDAEACTDDACDAGRCVYTTRDGDGDLHGDGACPAIGGVPADDCDDADPEVFTGAPERCNGLDDDCDMDRDEDFDCVLGEQRACSVCGPGRQACNSSCTGFGDCVGADVVALWSFDAEPDSARFTDRVGAHDGSFRAVSSETPRAVAGPFGCGEALGFAADGWGEVADHADFDLAEGTFAAWVRFDVNGVAQGVFSRDEELLRTPGHFTITRLATDVLEARIQDGTRSFFRCTSLPVPSGRWVEIVVHFGPPDFDFVVDGVRANGCALDSTTSGIVGADNPLVFGASQQFSSPGTSEMSGRNLGGALDHVSISRRRAAPNLPEITSVILVDADADSSLGVLDEGAVLVLADLPNITLRVTTDPGTVGSVTMVLDGSLISTEGLPPYALDDDSGDYLPFPFTPGTHTLEATPYTGGSASGVAGPTARVTFEVR